MQFYLEKGRSDTEIWILHDGYGLMTDICLRHRVDQAVDCGLLNVGPLLFDGGVKLLEVGRNWNNLMNTPV